MCKLIRQCVFSWQYLENKVVIETDFSEMEIIFK